MIPIEKNIIVTDINGNLIGTTYPKRVKGLLKNGRAEYVSDREIRLKNTRAPAVNIITEEVNMSKVIDFNTRDFEFEDTCKSNVGFRGFITTSLGNEEIWEIGDWGWNWTQICTVLKGLEKNTDYVFRFAMTHGHNDDGREESLVHIFRACAEDMTPKAKTDDTIESIPDKCIDFIRHSSNAIIAEKCIETGIIPASEIKRICSSSANPDEAVKKICDEFPRHISEKGIVLAKDAGVGEEPELNDSEEERKKAWDDRFTYCTGMSRFKPVISKRDKTDDTMLRVFELPFNTGECANWKIVIVSNHAVSRFFRAKDNASYSELEDLSFEQWYRERMEFLDLQQIKKAKAQAEAYQGTVGGVDMTAIEAAVQDSVFAAIGGLSISDIIEEKVAEALSDAKDKSEE